LGNEPTEPCSLLFGYVSHIVIKLAINKEYISEGRIRKIWLLGAGGSYLATWEAEIWRFAVQGQPGQIICETPFQASAGHGECPCQWTKTGHGGAYLSS
jgi:hypothetical protein